MNTYQHYLNFGCLIGVIIFMLYYRKTQKELFLQCKLKETTPAAYTIAVKHIPNLQKNIEEELMNYFSNIDGKSYDVKNVNLCYDLTERAKMHKKYEKLLKRKQKLIKMNSPSSIKELDIINKEILFNEQEKRNYDINIHKDHLEFCGIAFITFNTVKEKKEIMKKSLLTLFDRIKIFFNKNTELSRGLIFHEARLIIEQAPEPNEILFNNLHSNVKEKIKIRFITFLLTVLEIGIFGIIIYYLLSFQYNYFAQEISTLSFRKSDYDNDEATYNETMILLYFYSGCISLLIVIINNVFIVFITKMIVKKEKYSTYTRKKISLTSRLSLVLISFKFYYVGKFLLKDFVFE